MRIESSWGRWEVRTDGDWLDGKAPRALITHYDLVDRSVVNEIVLPFEEAALPLLIDALQQALAEMGKLREAALKARDDVATR